MRKFVRYSRPLRSPKLKFVAGTKSTIRVRSEALSGLVIRGFGKPVVGSMYEIDLPMMSASSFCKSSDISVLVISLSCVKGRLILSDVVNKVLVDKGVCEVSASKISTVSPTAMSDPSFPRRRSNWGPPISVSFPASPRISSRSETGSASPSFGALSAN